MTTQYAIQITAKDTMIINPAMPVPEVGPTQILLKIQACGICFSDTKLMHAFDSHPRKSPILAGLTDEQLAQIPTYRPGAEPVVPGHEPVGVIAKIGDQVTQYTVGQRVLIQTDYRHLPTAGSNGSFGYDFDGALEEYALVDLGMVIDPDTGESYLIPVSDGPSSSAVALIEPWACVENAYAWQERQAPAGGSMLIVADPGCVPVGLGEVIEHAAPQSVVSIGDPSGAEAAAQTTLDQLTGTFDDIIYIGANPDTLEALGPHLGKRGLMNIVTCGSSFSRPAKIDVGRVHYDLIRYVGTTGSQVADGYSWVPESCELRDGDHVAVIGAAGPMGLMHAVRTAISDKRGIDLDAADVDDDRLARLHAVLEPIAARTGVPTRVVNSMTEPLKEGSYTYVSLMVPSPGLLQQAVGLAAPGAIVNAFAGFAIGTTAELDINALISRRTFIVGTSGSRIKDMETVLARLEAGIIDTNISLDAITGIAGVPDAVESVNNRTSQGKIMVYPWLHDLGLTRLSDLAEKMPDVAARMVDGKWTKEAELMLAKIA